MEIHKNMSFPENMQDSRSVTLKILLFGGVEVRRGSEL